MTYKKEKWEERFDEEFVDKVKNINGKTAYLEWQAYGEEELIENIKDFIRQLLETAKQEERARIMKEIEKLNLPKI